ncbi:hypothetical protein B0J13DRAFT_554787 [Dactylonectria estremocensis]|uniref:Peptidase M10 metallopeptidase domain-containing protein n=1 Tax=Dactylonectria estremocensis TaxID=1079267 RepID=A0A9P9EUL6_9HYPO|nr:hypothetical protein B0J13DRAFT_554787 [Dactylonectria estremocensis]
MPVPPLPPFIPVESPGIFYSNVAQPRAGEDGAAVIPPIFRWIRGGSWLLEYTPRGTTARYDGTLRVENHQAGEPVTGRTASGDLYLRRTSLARLPNGSTIPVNVPAPNPTNGIPILARDRYRYYVRVTKIDENFSVGSTFNLELEFYHFSQAPPHFTNIPSDTYTVAMTWKVAPAGYPSPRAYAEGDVKSKTTGEVVGVLKMGWLSQYYRKITVEIDTVDGAPPPLQNGGSPTTQNWKTVFDRVGFQLTQITSQTDVPDTPQDPWDVAELHATMIANRQTSVTNLDFEWRYHLLAVRKFQDAGLFGIMYDTKVAGPGADPNNTPREGLAIGSELKLQDIPEWGVNSGKQFAQATSPYFRTALHELGHAFGLYHTEADHSFMARTANILRDSTDTAPFDSQITWNYSSEDLKRLRHFPDAYVRPGGVDFSMQNDERPQLPDDSAVDVPGLKLTLKPLRVDVPLGAPVRVSLTITNEGDSEILVPKNFGLSSSFTSGTVTDSAGMVRAFRPLVVYDRIEELAPLAKGNSTSTSLTLLGGPDGPLFKSSGLNTVTANVSWNVASGHDGDQPAIVSLFGSTTVLVMPPVDPDHALAAHAILTTPSTHTLLVLGGRHLEDAIKAYQGALENKTLGRHFAAVEARRLVTKFFKQKPDTHAAEEVLAKVGDVVASGPEADKLKRLGVNSRGNKGA